MTAYGYRPVRFPGGKRTGEWLRIGNHLLLIAWELFKKGGRGKNETVHLVWVV